MNRSQFTRSLALFLLVAGAIGHPHYGAANGLAAALEPPQQPKSAIRAPLEDLFSKSRVSRCAVKDPLGAEQLAIDEAAGKAHDNRAVVTSPVYWHIITTANGGGNVSALVPAQMDVLQAAYASSGFSFELKNVQVVANDAWFFAEAGSADEAAMKAALRRGGPETLNIYTTNGDVYLGWATLAFYYKFFPSYDGVVLWWAALPGTGLAGPAEEEPDGILTYDQGDTGTHEVGHWLGLDHTFAGGCSHPGDSIKDTPAEAEPQFFCVARDSCTGSPFRGADPITNFMDYVDDVCMDNFTSDQTKRMRKHWHAFRDKKQRQ
jgi:hypothetical protein